MHVTNGDSAAALIRESGLGGEVLPWQDPLHDGPVLDGLPPKALAEVRARHSADSGWAPFPKVREAFARRDAALTRTNTTDEIVLWFEHDLYDQLQLIQILDRLADQRFRRRPSPGP
jgi:hypothetical protein